MAYRFSIKEKAIEDALNAYLYYEEKTIGLGERFLTALQERIDQITVNPQHYTFIDKQKKLRGVKLKGFPYVVIFDIIDENVTVYFVHNTYQNSKY